MFILTFFLSYVLYKIINGYIFKQKGEIYQQDIETQVSHEEAQCKGRCELTILTY